LLASEDSTPPHYPEKLEVNAPVIRRPLIGLFLMTIDDDWIDKACEADPLPIEDIGDDESADVGPPLTSEEIESARARLALWQAAQIFRDDVKALNRRCLSWDFFLNPHLKFLHDGDVLADFANLRCVDQVRLAAPKENWPDGYVKIRGRSYAIEVTSAHGGRKLGEEYRALKGKGLVVEHDSVEDWVARAESIPFFLEKAIREKADKCAQACSSVCWLVVYLNISEWGIRQYESEQVIAGLFRKYRERFQNLSVLWKGSFTPPRPSVTKSSARP
jgi:hypothetical protein